MTHWLFLIVAAIASLFNRMQALEPPPTPSPVPVVESSREQTAPAVVEFREPVVEPAPPDATLPLSYYQPSLADGNYTFCLTDESGLGLTDAWVSDNVSTYWGAAGTADCAAPDLTITVRAFFKGSAVDYCGWALSKDGIIELNARCFTTSGFTWDGHDLSGDYVGLAALLHEWGHFAGFGHADAPSTMYPIAVYLPTDSDRASLAKGYGW